MKQNKIDLLKTSVAKKSSLLVLFGLAISAHGYAQVASSTQTVAVAPVAPGATVTVTGPPITTSTVPTIPLVLAPTPTFQIASDQELAPLTNYLSNYVYQTKQARFVFHWFQGTDSYVQSKFGNVFTGNLSSTDPVGLQYVQGMSKRYFNYDDSSDPGSGNMFGPGLYAAVDPVATRSYGGTTSWVLVQIQLPVGFTMFDLTRDGGDTPPLVSPIFDVLQKIGCPTDWEYDTGMLNNLFNPETHKNPSCTATIEHILKDKLQVDGFLYAYSYTAFKACMPPLDPNSPSNSPDDSYRRGAFVITDGSKFKANNIRIFNSNTTDDLQDRIDIESAFYQADQDAPNFYNSQLSVTTQMLYAQYPAYQGWTIQSTYQSCLNSCPPYVAMAYICPPIASAVTPPVTSGTSLTTTNPLAQSTPPPACTSVSIAPPATQIPTVISSKAVPVSGASCFGQGCTGSPLLWNDLDGTLIDPQLATYMKANYYSCSGKPDYE